MIRWVMAAGLLWLPTASGAATAWVGYAHARFICPGLGSTVEHEDFTLEMEPGSGLGTLTIAGIGSGQVVTDWTVDGRWGYFSASIADPANGPLVLYGWIRGNRMKGWITGHDYLQGCMTMGKIRAWL
jgi:hypothetical protein